MEKMETLKPNLSKREQKVIEDQAKRKDSIINADKQSTLVIMDTEKFINQFCKNQKNPN